MVSIRLAMQVTGERVGLTAVAGLSMGFEVLRELVRVVALLRVGCGVVQELGLLWQLRG